MTWFAFWLVVLLTFAIPTVLGGLVLWLSTSGRRSAVMWLLTPVFGLGVLAVLTFLAIPFGNWSWVWPSAAAVLLIVANLFVRKHRISSGANPSAGVGWRKNSTTVVLAMAGVALFFAVYVPGLESYWTDPANPQSWGDAAFHTQGTLLILESGDTSPLTALAEIFDPIAGSPVYYPTLWHATAALLAPAVGVAVAHNALSLVIGLVIWPLALSGLALALSRKTSAVLWAPALAVMLPIFPGSILFGNAIAPFALSLMTVPAGVAILILWCRPTGETEVSRKALAGYLGLLVLASLAAQPSTTVLLALAVVLTVVVTALRHFFALWPQGRKGLAVAGSAGVLLGFAVATLVATQVPLIKTLGTFSRDGVPLDSVIVRFLKGVGSVYTYLPWTAIIMVAVLGALMVIREAAGQVTAAVFVAYFALYALGSGYDIPLRAISGFWYKDFTRLGTVAYIGIITFAAVAIAGVLWAGAKRFAWGRPITALVNAALFLALAGLSLGNVGGVRSAATSYVARGYSLDNEVSNMLTADKVELLSHVDDAFPPGSYIIGAPSTGVEFVAQLSHSKNFLTLNPPRTEQQKFLAQDIEQILTDPAVCQVLGEAQVVGVVTTTEAPDQPELEAYEGLFQLVPGEGFELIAHVGDLSLWKITACD